MAFALDTTCVVAALCSWHPRHRAVTQEIDLLLQQEPPLILPAPVLVEAFSVLTRMPPPHRVSPKVALRALADSFRQLAVVATLDAEAYWAELESAAANSIHGGAVHDAIIARCARAAGATKLLTLNPAHFINLGRGDLLISVPR